MKKRICLLGMIVGLFGLLIVLFIQQTSALDESSHQNELGSIALNNINDGTYYGVYESNLVSAEVEVVVVNHTIVDIIIKRHDTLFGKEAEGIIDGMIEHQSIEVDDVAGATYSSQVIKRAIEDALNKQ